MSETERTCRVCGCTDTDCRRCIEKTGEPCYWVEQDLCSACAGAPKASLLLKHINMFDKTAKEN